MAVVSRKKADPRFLLGAGASLTAASLIAGALVTNVGYMRAVLVAAIGLLFAGVVIRSPQSALYWLLLWLTSFGLLRRLLSTVGPAGPLGDPLVLVAPLVWLSLAIIAFSHGALRARTTLSGAVLLLTCLLTVSAVNPLAGGLAGGVSGLLVVVPPMLAFWVGRSMVDVKSLRRLLLAVAALSIPAAVYGLIQVFVGFPPWDDLWIMQNGYGALNVGGGVRPFASFASGSEYAGFLATSIVVLVALTITNIGRRVLVLPPLVLLSAALWLESSRGIVVFTVMSLSLIICVRRRLRGRSAIVLSGLVLASVPWLVAHLVTTGPTTGTSAGLVSHQVEGLSDPLGSNSTLGLHTSLVIDGIASSIKNPIGQGVAAVTLASSKFGVISAGTEADPGNAAVAAGALGFLAYLTIVATGLPLAYREALASRDPVALAALAILAVTLLQWLNGAQYAVAPLPWLVLGWLDSRPRLARPSSSKEAKP